MIQTETDYFNCSVCRKDYSVEETSMLEWAITPTVRFNWCEHCDRNTDSHQGMHKWQSAVMDALVMAVQRLSKEIAPAH